MQRSLSPLLLLTAFLLSVGPVAADEENPAGKPERLTEQQAADKVLDAVQAKDEQALGALAREDDPDPWLVADLLCSRGQHDAAQAFAEAAPRLDTEKLAGYVQAWRQRGPDKAERELIAAMDAAMEGREPQRVVEGTASPAPRTDTVVGLRLMNVRGAALSAMRRLGESGAVLREAAEAAEELGWLAFAARLWGEAGASAFYASNWKGALATTERAHALAKRRGDKVAAAQTLAMSGIVLHSLGEFVKGLETLEQALAEQRAVGDRAGAAQTLAQIGAVHVRRGDYAKALEPLEQALPELRALGDRASAARALGNIALVHSRRGDYAKALEALEQTLAEFRAAGDKANAAAALGNMGTVQQHFGDHARALRSFEQVLTDLRALGNRAGAAMALMSLGNVHKSLGDFAKALACYEQALAEKMALGDEIGAALCLGNLGTVHLCLGDHAKALEIFEQALAQHRALGNRAGAATALMNLGTVHANLGDLANAQVYYGQALAEQRALGERAFAAGTLMNIGTVLQKQGDHAKALACFEQALAEQRALGDRAGAAVTLGNIGAAYDWLGDIDKARQNYEQALAEQEALGHRYDEGLMLLNLGYVYQRLGDRDRARRLYEQGARAAKSLRAAALLVSAQRNLAHLHLVAGEPHRALSAAQSALREVETLLGGLGQEEGARAREQHVSLFALGALAAVRAEDAAEVLTFLESGRAGALLDALDKRDALRWKAEALPPELRQQDLDAQARESVARRAYDLAVQRKDLKATRVATVALDEATEQVRQVAGRIQRELKQQAGLFYPRAKTIEEVEKTLEPGQALVLYGLCRTDGLDEALALVLRSDGERIVSLGKTSAVEAACEALHATDTDTDAAPALKRLRALLVEPLGLAGDVKQVLISPEGALCYVPFGALFEQAVGLTPSGTTHVLLRGEDRARGEGVLALGAPDYGGVSQGAQAIYHRGRTLALLPATRLEVETIGTQALLGAKASEAGLREALVQSQRWRAVHFACHGLVDVERPMLSSLALSRAGDDDGFLTALEILRMKIPADLAVLSACETATGRIVKGEGIVGLTRAFMFAGSPRVLCSLWKVDDEATQALMIKFYALWNPKEGEGLGAAEALQKAQEYVRNFKDDSGTQKWKHPYYWAAWVLWGLPD
jgi:CHAT domain-containing protein/Tfp pilus assembly protein PilF